MQAKRYLISGRVQGVAFRYYTERAARELGVNGFARNLPDGRVEALAQGDAAQLLAFYEAILKGPPSARVDSVEVRNEQTDPQWTDFRITF